MTKNITGLSDSGKSMLPTKRGANTGAMKTPPPVRPAQPLLRARDSMTDYGDSGAPVGSSLMPGQKAPASWLRDDIVASNGDTELARIAGHDTRTKGHYAVESTDPWQTRPVNKTGIRPAENMKPDPNASGSPSGKVASSGLASDEEQPVRQP